jgi:hypothetical protein
MELPALMGSHTEKILGIIAFDPELSPSAIYFFVGRIERDRADFSRWPGDEVEIKNERSCAEAATRSHSSFGRIALSLCP